MKQAIIVIGGHNSIWPAYLSIARDLEDLTGLQTVAVPLLPWDWWSAERNQDATNILHKLTETVLWARRRFRADRFVLIGHSAGGVVARLYLVDQPVWGQVYAGTEHVGSVITLGSPHCADRATETDWYLTREANRLAPGAPASREIRCRTVAGRSLLGRPSGTLAERTAYGRYRFFTGSGNLWGDGVVPVQSAALDGAENLVLDGIVHSAKYGRGWYGGSKAIISRWWFQGVESGQ